MKLPAGKPLNMEEAESFIKSRKERMAFNGLVEMQGSTETKDYKIELLMSEGEVMGIEITGIEDTPTQGDSALDGVKRLAGSEGELKLISFRDENMDAIIKENSGAILEKKVMLENFKIRIKPTMAKEVCQEKPGMLDTIKKLFSAPAPAKREFKGQFKLESQTHETETEDANVKKQIINRIKDRRFGRMTEQLIAKRKQEQQKMKDAVSEGKLVETTIDKLFNLIDKRDKLKVNDALAKELGISKEKIEEWAVILEEHNLVTINYPTIGEPEITKKGFEKAAGGKK